MDIFIEALVISPELRRKISQIAREMGFDYDVIISTLIVTPDNLQM
jgi:hypothetical protein